MARKTQHPAQAIIAHSVMNEMLPSDMPQEEKAMRMMFLLKKINDMDAKTMQFNNTVFVFTEKDGTAYASIFSLADPDRVLSVLQFLAMLQIKNIKSLVLRTNSIQRAAATAKAFSDIFKETKLDSEVTARPFGTGKQGNVIFYIGEDSFDKIAGLRDDI